MAQIVAALFLFVKFTLFQYNKQSAKVVKILVIHYEKLSKAVDAFNANRIESEQVTYQEIVKSIKDPLDSEEVLLLCIELYEDAF